MYSVSVLMSTYNGAKYVREQIESILSQIGVEVKLTVRDDGSNDLTCEILKEYASLGKIALIKGENVGVSKSFFILLDSSPDCDFYAFSDQDDIWHNDKLLNAVKCMELSQKEKNCENGVLYFCNKNLVDSNGNYITKKSHFFVQSCERAFFDCVKIKCE